MSNYKSQLRAWAVDRIINSQKGSISLENLQKDATALAEWAYIADEDLDTTAKQLLELVAGAAPEKAKIGALIHELQYIQEQRYAKRIDAMPEEETNVAPH